MEEAGLLLSRLKIPIVLEGVYVPAVYDSICCGFAYAFVSNPNTNFLTSNWLSKHRSTQRYVDNTNTNGG